MVREPVIGTAAGAVGPVALNAAAYAGMVVRGLPASGVPARVAGGLLERAGIGLSGECEGCRGDTVQNRRSGLGALSGYVLGYVLGVGYGLIRSRPGDGSKLRVGFVPGLAAMTDR